MLTAQMEEFWFSEELMVKLKLNIYENRNFKLINSLNYNFSLLIGQNTGYRHVDAFYKQSYDKVKVLVEKSLSKIQI